jgi:hypothetical protein
MGSSTHRAVGFKQKESLRGLARPARPFRPEYTCQCAVEASASERRSRAGTRRGSHAGRRFAFCFRPFFGVYGAGAPQAGDPGCMESAMKKQAFKC